MALVLPVLLLAASALAGDVLVLTDDTFDDAIKAHENILVEFYAPWCGHCKKLEPEYSAAATALKGRWTLAKVDSTVEKAVSGRFGIKGYPTLKVFRNGEPSDYKGGRTTDTIVSYLDKLLKPALSSLASAEAVEAFKGEAKVVVVGSFPDKESTEYARFSKAAAALSEDFVFGEFVNAGVAAPSIVLYKQFDEGSVTFEGEYESAAIVSWIKTSSIPLIDEVGPENYRTYIDTGLPLLFIFVDPKEKQTFAETIALLTPVARAERGVINFVWCDGVKYSQQAKHFGLGSKMPAIAIVRTADNVNFVYTGSMSDSEAVAAWLVKFNAGELSPTIKSDPIPTEQKEAVFVVVGDTFEQIAYDTTKDVLVEFYAPWCGHCKSLAPIYEELAETLKPVSSIVIAKMDGTTNDAVGVSIQGFPTIKFFPAGSERKMIDYNDDRTVAGFLRFLKKHATVPFELPGEGHDHHGHDHHGHDHHGHDHHGHDHHGHGHDDL